MSEVTNQAVPGEALISHKEICNHRSAAQIARTTGIAPVLLTV
jgi:hypothetical protein